MFYWFLKVILTPVLRVVFRPTVEGVENIPLEGAAILASNHLSYMDWLALPLVVPRRITYLAKSDYFTGTGVKGRLKRAFFTGAGQVPIDRSGADAASAALVTGLRVLGEGKLLGIFPEGTRSLDGRLYRGKTGVARMALQAGVPVIPCAMIGMFEVAPPGSRLPKIRKVGVRIGPPLDFARYEGMDDDRFVLRSMTDELMYELMRLSGQEYVDTYAQQAKLDAAARRRAAQDGDALGAAPSKDPAGPPRPAGPDAEASARARRAS